MAPSKRIRHKAVVPSEAALAAAAAALRAARAAEQRAAQRAKILASKRRKMAKEFGVGPAGDVFALGSNDFGQTGHGEGEPERARPARVEIGGAEQAVEVACGGMHSVALTCSGTVLTWGVNDEGALGRPTSGSAWLGASEDMEDSFTPGRARLPDGERRQAASGCASSLAATLPGRPAAGRGARLAGEGHGSRAASSDAARLTRFDLMPCPPPRPVRRPGLHEGGRRRRLHRGAGRGRQRVGLGPVQRRHHGPGRAGGGGAHGRRPGGRAPARSGAQRQPRPSCGRCTRRISWFLPRARQATLPTTHHGLCLPAPSWAGWRGDAATHHTSTRPPPPHFACNRSTARAACATACARLRPDLGTYSC
jgi:hypothetical protein